MTKIERAFEAEELVDPNYSGRVLTAEEIEKGVHRQWVGGHWSENGEHQLEYLKANGLKPEHKFLDVGCGSLRLGRHLVNYLNPGNYYGIDANQSVVEAGYDTELTDEERKRLPIGNLRATDRFGVDFGGVKFDYAIAQSVFTHISLNNIRLCLYRVAKVMKPGGIFFATIFERGPKYPLDGIVKTKGGKPKFQERNCYWYYRADLRWAARVAPWAFKYIGDWKHPANQQMIQYTRTSD